MHEDPNIVVENELLRRGFTSVPNYIFGLPISSNAKLVYMALLSYAWTNSSCYPGLAKLCRDVSLSDKPVTKAIEELSAASLLEVKRRGQGKTNLYILKDFNFTPQSASGSGTRVGETPNQESENLRIKNRTMAGSRIGGSPPPKSEKRRIPQEEKNSEENLPTETHPHKGTARAARSAGVVGGSSKFTLEECRRFAEHLQATGQGINNPGGYATTIYRSGEADRLIEQFLQPPTVTESADASLCADCGGTGFWYPGGPAAGVAKCKHEGLRAERAIRAEKPTALKLPPQEINERAAIITQLLESGYTIEQATQQFAAGFHPDDWVLIRDAARLALQPQERA